jgi:GNAT superfamily N-acetyltransferase
MTEGEGHDVVEPEPFVLRDGRTMLIRRIVPEDDVRLVAFHRTLSPRTRRFRFFSAMKELEPHFATHLANVDFVGRAAFLAVFADDGEMGAVARYERDSERSAEVAFVVHDSLQGQGLGTELLQHLAALARTNGFESLTAVVLSENYDMLDVFRHSGLPQRMVTESDVTRVTMDIRPKATPPSPTPG